MALQVCLSSLSLPLPFPPPPSPFPRTYTHRYLHKLFSQHVPASQLPSNVDYLASDYPLHKYCGVKKAGQFMDHHVQLEAYRQRARR